jgi:hypothetical protein
LKTIAMLALLCLMFYIVFLQFFIEHYPNGHPQTEDVVLCTMLTQKYGPTLEPDELKEFLQMRDELVRAADRYIIDAFDDIANAYERGPTLLLQNAPSDIYRARWEDMIATGEYRGIISSQATSNTIDYAQNLAVLVALATLLCLGPLLTSDRARKLHLLQYTSKQGRKIMGKQGMAVLLSSAMLTTALLLVFGAIYARNGTQVFWNNYISSFNGYYTTSIPLTFGQFVIIIAVMIYLIGAALSMFAFILSRFCPNYIALIASLIPVFIVGVMLCKKIFFNPLNGFKFGLALFDPIVCTSLLALAMMAVICVLRREQKVDIG